MLRNNDPKDFVSIEEIRVKVYHDSYLHNASIIGTYY